MRLTHRQEHQGGGESGPISTWAHAWPAVGRLFTGLTAAGLTGLLAALAVILLAGGYATIRRATV
jgi:hypothetical protein